MVRAESNFVNIIQCYAKGRKKYQLNHIFAVITIVFSTPKLRQRRWSNIVQMLFYSGLSTLSGYSLSVNTELLYNICTMLDQRLRLWSNIVQMYTNVMCAGSLFYPPPNEVGGRGYGVALDVRLQVLPSVFEKISEINGGISFILHTPYELCPTFLPTSSGQDSLIYFNFADTCKAVSDS